MGPARRRVAASPRAVTVVPRSEYQALALRSWMRWASPIWSTSVARSSSNMGVQVVRPLSVTTSRRPTGLPAAVAVAAQPPVSMGCAEG